VIIRSLGVRVDAERGLPPANHPVPGFFRVTGSGVPFVISSAQLSLASITWIGLIEKPARYDPN